MYVHTRPAHENFDSICEWSCKERLVGVLSSNVINLMVLTWLERTHRFLQSISSKWIFPADLIVKLKQKVHFYSEQNCITWPFVLDQFLQVFVCITHAKNLNVILTVEKESSELMKQNMTFNSLIQNESNRIFVNCQFKKPIEYTFLQMQKKQ